MNEVTSIVVSVLVGAAGASWIWYFVILPFMQAHKMLKECQTIDITPAKHDSSLKHV